VLIHWTLSVADPEVLAHHRHRDVDDARVQDRHEHPDDQDRQRQPPTPRRRPQGFSMRPGVRNREQSGFLLDTSPGPVRPGGEPTHGSAHGDQPVATDRRRQQPNQRGQDCTISPIQAQLRSGSTQHGNLVAQHQQLDILGCRARAKQQQPTAQPAEDQVQRPQRRGTRSCLVGNPPHHRRSCRLLDGDRFDLDQALGVRQCLDLR
jgi:hypothetical protein